FGPENLGVPRDELARRVAWALEMVGMAAFRERSVAQLSGGQKQRVAIAAVLAMTPEVLIMDDPTAELDPAGTAQVLELVRSVRERMPEMTVIMTSGDPEPLVAGADRIAVLRDGRLVAVDAPERLFADFADHFAAGVPAPPVYGLARELNRALNTSFTFHTTEAAAAGLGELLDARS
ncbi:MAG TPA: ATP-binding cassette domain-containing protein, partial [Thermomicrobiales bacterium]|nr:ATP-binding cassette domain-containing protein [Thermomicrobiales bacterium]